MKRMNQLQILLYVLHIFSLIPLWSLWRDAEEGERRSGWVECRQADIQKYLMLYGGGMNPLWRKGGGTRQIEGEEKEVEWTKESTWQDRVEVVYSDPCSFKSYCRGLCCAVCWAGRLPEESGSEWVSKGPDWGKICVCVVAMEEREIQKCLQGPKCIYYSTENHMPPCNLTYNPLITHTNIYRVYNPSQIMNSLPKNESLCHHCAV